METPDRKKDGRNQPANSSDEGTNGLGREREVGLVDLLVILARHRRFLKRSVIVCTAVAFVAALFLPNTFTSSAKMIRETQSEVPGGLGGGLSALQGLGINLGGMTEGLSPEAFPKILYSRDVKYVVARDTFSFPGEERRMTYFEYHSQSNAFQEALGTVKEYTIGLPGKLVRELHGGTSDEATDADDTVRGPTNLTKDQERALLSLGDLIYNSVDQDSGIMTISVQTKSPRLSFELVDSVIRHLDARIREIRTEKARQNLQFLEDRFEKARDDLRRAEEKLDDFLDQNQNIASAKLRTEQERLQRQVRFKSEVYSELQAKVTQAEIDLQRSEPVLTVVEQPAISNEPSSPNRRLIVMLGVVLGGLVGIGGAFVLNTFDEKRDSDEEEKWNEVKEALSPVLSLRDRLSFSREGSTSNGSSTNHAERDPDTSTETRQRK
jgi:capsular polysaccharide biosynthesis protein